MPIFTALDDTRVIRAVLLTDQQLCTVRSQLMMALDYNPSEPEFRDAMLVLNPVLGIACCQQWILALARIHTSGERTGCMNFMLEDNITSWSVSDFIDQKNIVARIA